MNSIPGTCSFKALGWTISYAYLLLNLHCRIGQLPSDWFFVIPLCCLPEQAHANLSVAFSQAAACNPFPYLYSIAFALWNDFTRTSE
jgi:hypothetical protein